MPNRFDLLANNYLGVGQVNITTKAGLALDVAYVFGASGKAVAVKFFAPTSGNLTDVHFFVTAITGAPGNLTVQLRNAIAGNPEKPNTTVHATQTVSPGAAANKWIKCTFGTPYSVTRGVMYWIVIGDLAGSAGNNAAVAYAGGIAAPTRRMIRGYTTVDGFLTDGTDWDNSPPFVLKFADGTIFGNPYTTNANHASSALERGLKIVGLTEDLIAIGATFGVPGAAPTTLKIYSGAAAPGSAGDLTVTLSPSAPDIGYQNFAPFTLLKNTIYRLVFGAGGGAFTMPGYFTIEDSSTFADVLACGFGGGRLYGTIDNGAGGWTDEADKFPKMWLHLQDQVQIARAAHPFQGVFA